MADVPELNNAASAACRCGRCRCCSPRLSQYSDVAGVRYPGAYNDFLAVVDLVNLDLGFILSFACVYDTNFYDRLLMTTIGPAVILGVLGCTYLVACQRNRYSDEVGGALLGGSVVGFGG